MQVLGERGEPSRFGPWFWSARVDLATFGGSALLSLALVAFAHRFGFDDSVPEWAWIAFVLGIDVAHVWATVFRTYFDGDEVRRHRTRYLLIPVLAYAAGAGLYWQGTLVFWGALAYLAVFHFIRQQVGWVALYRARAGDSGIAARAIDGATVYACTLYPLVHWHAVLPSRHFNWFVAGDFANVSAAATMVEPVFRWAWLVCIAGFSCWHLAELITHKRFQTGKVVVVMATAVLWYVGIVATNSDFDFTVTNVIAHGAPYLVLLWTYGRARRREAPNSIGSRIVALGPAVFVGILVAFAYAEEFGWDHLVWHERAWLFGPGGPTLGHLGLSLVVPLLAIPQAVHYVVDGFVWRRKESGAALRAALGFTPAQA